MTIFLVHNLFVSSSIINKKKKKRVRVYEKCRSSLEINWHNLNNIEYKRILIKYLVMIYLSIRDTTFKQSDSRETVPFKMSDEI